MMHSSKKDKSCVDVALIVNHENHKHQQLSCCICLQIMIDPHVVDCQAAGAKHIFGANCINSWIKKAGKKCPLCRNKFNSLMPSTQLAEQAGKLTASCKQCEVILPVTQISSHLKTCVKRRAMLEARLGEVITKQLYYLQQQINPHVRQAHSQIYKTYVQQWKWLYQDTRNWKWWWWCSNPWWENKSCPQCNTLWHKYEVQIDSQQEQRIALLEQLANKVQEEEAGEKVQCKSE